MSTPTNNASVFLLNIPNLWCPDCGKNSIQFRVLPTVKAPVKSSEVSNSNSSQTVEQSINGSHTAAEAYLQEAYKEVGFSTPYTVSLSLSCP